MRPAILFSLIPLAACTGASSEAAPSSDAAERVYQVGAFDKINLAGSPSVVVRTGSENKVRAEGDPAFLDRLEVTVENGTLKIGHKKSNLGLNFNRGGKATFYVTAPALAGASIGGSGDISIDKIDASRFTSSVSGSGTIDIGALRTDAADFSIAGSGDINAAGTAALVKMNIAGSGNLNLRELQSRTAKVSVAGSGNAHAYASETAEVSIVGSGNVTMDGSAKCTVHKLGSGNVRCSS